MPITRRFTVYTNAGVSVPPVIHVNQYDRGETWIFTLLEPNGSQYIPASGGIVGIKADGHAIINTATVNSNGEVVVSETQQMTAAAGKAVYEIIFDNSTHGTANFIVCVEPKPGDNATLSDSDLSLIQKAIESTIPANIEASVQDWMDDNLAPAEWVIDNTLSIAGAAADAKKVGDVTSELKTKLNDKIGIVATDLEQVIVTNQENQLYQVSGGTYTPNFDSVNTTGYFNALGEWKPRNTEEPYSSYQINSKRVDYDIYIPTVSGVCILDVFDGEPSSDNFIHSYTSYGGTLPTESNKLTIEQGQYVTLAVTDTTTMQAYANTVLSYGNGVYLEALCDEYDERLLETNANIDEIAPVNTDTVTETIPSTEYTAFGNKTVGADGTFYDNSSYYSYYVEITRSGKFSMRNFGNSTYGFIALYNGIPSQSTFVERKYNGVSGDLESTLQPFDVTAGQYIFVSVNLISTVFFNSYLSYPANDRPSLFRHDQKIVWMGDSISMLQSLPHRVGKYMANTVYDCSFAGAALTYGSERYGGMSVMSLSAQIASGNFSDLETSLSNQQADGIDITGKRVNANTLEGLDFSTDVTDIVIMAGTNDLNNDYVTTTSDLTAFQTGVQSIITNLNTAYPNIRLTFITDPFRGDITPSNPDRHGHSLVDLNNIIKSVCEANNIAFYDLYHACGINAVTAPHFLMNDLLHQNEAGDILLSEKCAKWLSAN